MGYYGSFIVTRRVGGDFKTFPINKKEFLIGKQLTCDVRIYLPQIADNHCKISFEKEGQATLINFSKNGTMVNGEKLGEQDRRALNDKDIITIHDRTFRFEYSSPNAAKPQPTVHVSKPLRPISRTNASATPLKSSTRPFNRTTTPLTNQVKGHTRAPFTEPSKKSVRPILGTAQSYRESQIKQEDQTQYSAFSMLKTEEPDMDDLHIKAEDAIAKCESQLNTISDKLNQSSQILANAHAASDHKNVEIIPSVINNMEACDVKVKTEDSTERVQEPKQDHIADANEASPKLPKALLLLSSASSKKRKSLDTTSLMQPRSPGRRSSRRRSSLLDHTSLLAIKPEQDHSEPSVTTTNDATEENPRRKVTFGPDLSPEIYDRTLPPNSPLKRGKKTPSGTPALSHSKLRDVISDASEPLSVRRVTFGPDLSPEIFDKALPPNSPLKKGRITPSIKQTPLRDSVCAKPTTPSSSLLKNVLKQFRAKESSPITLDSNDDFAEGVDLAEEAKEFLHSIDPSQDNHESETIESNTDGDEKPVEDSILTGNNGSEQLSSAEPGNVITSSESLITVSIEASEDFVEEAADGLSTPEKRAPAFSATFTSDSISEGIAIAELFDTSMVSPVHSSDTSGDRMEVTASHGDADAANLQPEESPSSPAGDLSDSEVTTFPNVEKDESDSHTDDDRDGDDASGDQTPNTSISVEQDSAPTTPQTMPTSGSLSESVRQGQEIAELFATPPSRNLESPHSPMSVDSPSSTLQLPDVVTPTRKPLTTTVDTCESLREGEAIANLFATPSPKASEEKFFTPDSINALTVDAESVVSQRAVDLGQSGKTPSMHMDMDTESFIEGETIANLLSTPTPGSDAHLPESPLAAKSTCTPSSNVTPTSSVAESPLAPSPQASLATEANIEDANFPDFIAGLEGLGTISESNQEVVTVSKEDSELDETMMDIDSEVENTNEEAEQEPLAVEESGETAAELNEEETPDVSYEAMVEAEVEHIAGPLDPENDPSGSVEAGKPLEEGVLLDDPIKDPTEIVEHVKAVEEKDQDEDMEDQEEVINDSENADLNQANDDDEEEEEEEEEDVSTLIFEQEATVETLQNEVAVDVSEKEIGTAPNNESGEETDDNKQIDENGEEHGTVNVHQDELDEADDALPEENLSGEADVEAHDTLEVDAKDDEAQSEAELDAYTNTDDAKSEDGNVESEDKPDEDPDVAQLEVSDHEDFALDNAEVDAKDDEAQSEDGLDVDAKVVDAESEDLNVESEDKLDEGLNVAQLEEPEVSDHEDMATDNAGAEKPSDDEEMESDEAKSDEAQPEVDITDDHVKPEVESDVEATNENVEPEDQLPEDSHLKQPEETVVSEHDDMGLDNVGEKQPSDNEADSEVDVEPQDKSEEVSEVALPEEAEASDHEGTEIAEADDQPNVNDAEVATTPKRKEPEQEASSETEEHSEHDTPMKSSPTSNVTLARSTRSRRRGDRVIQYPESNSDGANQTRPVRASKRVAQSENQETSKPARTRSTRATRTNTVPDEDTQHEEVDSPIRPRSTRQKSKPQHEVEAPQPEAAIEESDPIEEKEEQEEEAPLPKPRKTTRRTKKSKPEEPSHVEANVSEEPQIKTRGKRTLEESNEEEPSSRSTKTRSKRSRKVAQEDEEQPEAEIVPEPLPITRASKRSKRTVEKVEAQRETSDHDVTDEEKVEPTEGKVADESPKVKSGRRKRTRKNDPEPMASDDELELEMKHVTRRGKRATASQKASQAEEVTDDSPEDAVVEKKPKTRSKRAVATVATVDEAEEEPSEEVVEQPKITTRRANRTAKPTVKKTRSTRGTKRAVREEEPAEEPETSESKESASEEVTDSPAQHDTDEPDTVVEPPKPKRASKRTKAQKSSTKTSARKSKAEIPPEADMEEGEEVEVEAKKKATTTRTAKTTTRSKAAKATKQEEPAAEVIPKRTRSTKTGSKRKADAVEEEQEEEEEEEAKPITRKRVKASETTKPATRSKDSAKITTRQTRSRTRKN